jgi:hypothetical protein
MGTPKRCLLADRLLTEFVGYSFAWLIWWRECSSIVVFNVCVLLLWQALLVDVRD